MRRIEPEINQVLAIGYLSRHQDTIDIGCSDIVFDPQVVISKSDSQVNTVY